MTETSIGERLRRLQETQQRQQEADAAWWSQHTFADFCPARPRYCPGEVPVDDGKVTWENNNTCRVIPCPHAESDCPHKRVRKQEAMMSHLRKRGFYERHCSPKMAEVRGAFREPVLAYVSTIDERIEAGEGLILGSAPGVGKTCILGLIAWAAREWKTSYCRSLTLHGWLRRSWEHTEDIGELRNSALLLIDDLGTESDDGDAQAHFHHLIDERCGRQRSTVITTNLFREDVEAMPHMQRVIDRLRSMSPWIEAVGEGSQRSDIDWREWEASS